MGQQYVKNNHDDVFLRSFSLAVLDLLNSQQMEIKNYYNGQESIIKVPYYYDRSGDARFYQDLYQNHILDDTYDLKQAEGEYNKVPSGIISITSIGVDEGSLTNKFENGEYTRIEDGVLKAFSAKINVLPIRISMDLEINLDTRINTWKVLQSYWDTFFRTLKFKYMFKGMTIAAYIGFPADVTANTAIEFSFGSEIENKLPISLECETFYPVINYSTERSTAKKIQSLTTNFTLDRDIADPVTGFDFNSMNDSYLSRVDGIGNPLGEDTSDNIDNNLHKLDEYGTPTEDLFVK